MIKSVEFRRFRGFEGVRAEMTPHAYIVGPNSAGKSTILEAIGLAEQCLRTARRIKPPLLVGHQGRRWRAYPLPVSADNEEDPVRHEFGSDEARVIVEWASGAKVHIVWPEETGDDVRGFFFLEEEGGTQPITPSYTKSLFSPVSIVPVVTPLDRVENLKNPGYVALNAGTRLASRHFRNHAWIMDQEGVWETFKAFCQDWLPEIELLDVSLDAAANRFAVFYREAGSRVPKELAWAGDGIQIWVQLLWHIFRAQGATTIVLDEPDVYLHPDLQRRLVRLLDGLSSQIVLASHSADLIAEAPPEGILWVDRRRGSARRVKSQQALSDLSASLGSCYNLALARSLRSRLVVASDCEDLRVFRMLAKQLGANLAASEHAITWVPLRHLDIWGDTLHFGRSLREVLPSKLPALVLIQGGHRPESLKAKITGRLAAPNLTVGVLGRPELENYLLDPETIARVSGAAQEAVALRILEACATLREGARSMYTAVQVGAAVEGGAQEVLAQAEAQFDTWWEDPGRRVNLVRGTQIIRELNSWLETDGYRPITAYKLSKSIGPQSIPLEMARILTGIDGSLQEH